MASRVHVIHDYSFTNEHARPRRQVRYQNSSDPIELPRSSVLRAGAGAFATALAMAALVIGTTYTAFRSAPPQLAETPALPLSDDWQPDEAGVARARVMTTLQGPAVAVPDRLTPTAEPEPMLEAAPTAQPREYLINDSAMYPKPAATSEPAPTALPEPYPNPTTTPPDAIAPPATDPQQPTPLLDNENPYR